MNNIKHKKKIEELIQKATFYENKKKYFDSIESLEKARNLILCKPL